ncbi:unnamed protein product [Meganyctiphanes norvegica]|uniref:F-box domain-containing protein n=1 Tax=Meganyctiphanes norvegica TaxID=48144 RepID=A0AAV2SM37_MEGNR
MNTCIWETLPPEILFKIFQGVWAKDLVYSVSLVCKTWYGILQQPQFWMKQIKYLGISMTQTLRNDLIRYQIPGDICYFLKTLVFIAKGFIYKGISHNYEEEGRWQVCEGNLVITAAFLMLREPYKLILQLEKNRKIEKNLHLLLTIVKYSECLVDFNDKNGWRTCDPSDDLIMSLRDPNSKCRISDFKGCIRNVSLMPPDVTVLCLSISDDEQASSILPELNNLEYLNFITLHVPSGCISLKSFVTCLPEMKYWGGSRTRLFISHAKDDDAQWIVEVIHKLMPPSCGYSWLVFTSCQLTLSGWCKVLEGISSTEAIVGMLAVSPRCSVEPWGSEELFRKHLSTSATYPYSPYEPGVSCEDYTSVHIYDSDSDIFDW